MVGYGFETLLTIQMTVGGDKHCLTRVDATWREEILQTDAAMTHIYKYLIVRFKTIDLIW